MPSASKGDRQIVSTAVARDGWALRHASPELWDDRPLVLEAVRRDGWALMYAAEAMRQDREVVLQACWNLLRSRLSSLSC